MHVMFGNGSNNKWFCEVLLVLTSDFLQPLMTHSLIAPRSPLFEPLMAFVHRTSGPFGGLQKTSRGLPKKPLPRSSPSFPQSPNP